MFFSWWRRVANRTKSSRRGRRPPTPFRAFRFRPAFEFLEAREVPSTVTFINPAGGDWNTPSNWSTGQVPNRFDDAVINLPVVVAHTQVDEIHTLTLGPAATLTLTGSSSFGVNGASTVRGTLNFNGGDLGIWGDVNDHSRPGTLTVNGTFNWNYGRIRGGALNIAAGGTGNFTGVFGEMDLGIPAEGATVNNAGQVNFTGGTLVEDNAAINNLANASFLITAPTGAIQSAVSPTSKLMTNAGTLRLAAPATAFTLGVPLTLANAAGSLLDVQTGTFTLTAGGTGNGGGINVAPGATLDLSGGGLPNYTGTYSATGGGRILLQNGILTATNLTFNFPVGLFQWTGGTIQGGSLTNTGFITLANTGQFLSANLFNTGTITDNDNAGGTFNFDSGTLFNQAGGLFDLKNDSQLLGGVTFNFLDALNNAGTFRKSGGTGTSVINVLLNNAANGVADIQTGTVTLIGGGISSGGTFNVAAGAVFDISFPLGVNPAYRQFQNMTGTYTGSGAGKVVISSGRTGVNGADVVFNFPAGLFQWTGGTIDSGVQTLTNTGFMTLGVGSGIPANLVGTLNNNGVITGNGIGLQLSAGTLNNQAGGLYDIRDDNGVMLAPNAAGLINNRGTFRKSGGTASNILAPLANAPGGTIDVESGTLALAGGGQSTGGNFIVGAGGVLDLTGGSTTQTFSGTYTGSGAGTVRLASGRLSAGIGAALLFNFPAGLFQWSGGTLDGGNLVLGNQGFITISGSTATLTGTLNNTGTITQTGSLLTLNNGTLSVLAGGTYDIQSDGGIGAISTSSINNAGTFDKSAGAASGINARFNNPSGTVSSSSGTLAFNSSVTQVTGGQLTAGTWQAANGGVLTINSAGNISTNGGNVILSGLGSAFTNIGTLTTNNGTLVVANGAALTTTGSFANAGTLVVGNGSNFTTPGNFTNTGSLTLMPGSTLQVNGALSEGAAATLAVQIGGPSASGQFGRVVSTGPANLGGTFNPTLVGGFLPSFGDQFQVLTFGSSSGNFGVTTGLQQGRNRTLTAQLAPTSLTLVAGPAVTHTVIQMAFVVGFDNQVYGQKFDANGNSVSPYFPIQVAPGFVTRVKAIAPSRDGNNNPLLFAIGLDDQVYAQKFTASGDQNGVWFLVKPGRVQSITAGADATGRPELFAIGLDNQVYALPFTAAGDPALPYYFAVQVAPGVTTQVKSVAVSRDASYNPLAFAIGLDDQVYEVKFDAAGNQASTWTLTKGGRVKALQVGSDGFLNPEVFVIGFDDQVYAQKFDAAGNSVSNYFLTSPGKVNALVVGHDAFNDPEVFIILAANSQAYALQFDANGNPAGGYFAVSPGSQVKAIDVGYLGTNTAEFFAVGLNDNLFGLQLDGFGNPVGNYFATQPGGILGVRLTV